MGPTAWEASLLWLKGQFSFYVYLVLQLLLATTVYHSVSCIHLFNRRWANSIEFMILVQSQLQREVWSAQCLANTKHPVEHKSERVKVTPCNQPTMSEKMLSCCSTEIHGDWKEDYKHARWCSLCFLLYSFSRIKKKTSLHVGSGLWVAEVLWVD